MTTLTMQQLGPILQLAVAPVILISGVGLLLLTITNRFGRMVDRARLLNHERRASLAAAETQEVEVQIQILLRRAGILRLAIALGAVTVLLAALLVLLLFLSGWFQLQDGGLIAIVFCVAMVSLLGSVGAFIADTNLALAAVRLEMKR